MARSLPEVTVVFSVAPLLPEIGSAGDPPLTEPIAVMVELETDEIWPVKSTSTLPPDGMGPAIVQE